MNGTIGERAQKIMSFCNKLKGKISLDIEFEDERLTTVSAERMLIEADVSRKKKRSYRYYCSNIYITNLS